MADLARHTDRFRAQNATLAVIGSGGPEHFDLFREKTGYGGLLFSDPMRDAYAVLNFSKGVTSLISLRPVLNAVRAFGQGHRQGPVQGNALQLGGAVIIDKAGTLRYYFAETTAGDHPDIDEMIAEAAP